MKLNAKLICNSESVAVPQKQIVLVRLSSAIGSKDLNKHLLSVICVTAEIVWVFLKFFWHVHVCALFRDTLCTQKRKFDVYSIDSHSCDKGLLRVEMYISRNVWCKKSTSNNEEISTQESNHSGGNTQADEYISNITQSGSVIP